MSPKGARALAPAGFVVNVANPKTALFFLAFLPQFIDADRGGVWSQALVLGFVFVGLGLVSDSLYALAAGTVGGADQAAAEARSLRLGCRVHHTRCCCRRCAKRT